MKLVALLAVPAVVTASPLLLQSRQSTAGGPTFTIANGTVRGTTLSGLNVQQFLGVRYGQTTAGVGRFANPRPVNTSFGGTFDATVAGNVCPGYGVSSYPNPATGQFYNVSEDCLTANIWRPANVNASSNLPILFWIFGGGFVQGTANDPRYNGSYIVARSVQMGQPVIVVGVNYRVAAFGFPAGNAAASAGVLNLGLKDQRLALRWLQDNAAGFGGNPKAVTIWGQSAGGSSVVWQNLAYGGRDDGLFRSSIVDSGVFVNQVNISLATKQTQWNALLNATGCSDDLACLRNLSFSAIYAAANGTFSPSVIIDNDFVVANQLKLFANGSYPKLPMILGSNLDEATSGIGAPTGVNTDADFTAVAARNFGVSLPNSTLQQMLQAFPNDPSRGCPYNTGDGVLPTGLQDKRVNDLFTSNIDAGVRIFASQRVAAGAATYRFHFTQVPQNVTIDAGCAHFSEIPYLFGVLNQTARNPASTRPADLELSRAMQEYFIRFTNSGNPNGGNNTNWPTYGTGKQAMQLKNNGVQLIDDTYRNASIGLLQSIAVSL